MRDKVYKYGWAWHIRGETASLLLRRFWTKNDWISSRSSWNEVRSNDSKWVRYIDEMRQDINGPDCITVKSLKA